MFVIQLNMNDKTILFYVMLSIDIILKLLQY